MKQKPEFQAVKKALEVTVYIVLVKTLQELGNGIRASRGGCVPSVRSAARPRWVSSRGMPPCQLRLPRWFGLMTAIISFSALVDFHLQLYLNRDHVVKFDVDNAHSVGIDAAVPQPVVIYFDDGRIWINEAHADARRQWVLKTRHDSRPNQKDRGVDTDVEAVQGPRIIVKTSLVPRTGKVYWHDEEMAGSSSAGSRDRLRWDEAPRDVEGNVNVGFMAADSSRNQAVERVTNTKDITRMLSTGLATSGRILSLFVTRYSAHADTLRKRVQLLEHVQSETSNKSKETDAGHHTEDASLTELEYEMDTESSEDLPLASMKRPDSLKLLGQRQNARPRRRSPYLSPDPSPEDVHKQNAHTELGRMEVFFLILATLSSFPGASFLRYILTLIAGKDVLTWFSTGLFLLATGIRPWMHTTEDLRQQLTDLKRQIEKMEHTLGKVWRRMDDGAEAMYDMRQHEKKCEKQDQRVKDVEISVDSLRKVRGRYLDANANPSLLSYVLPAWLVSPPPRPSVTKYPPPLSPSFSTASSSFGPPERLPTIPENGRLNLRKPAPEPPTRLGTRLLYGTVSLVTLPIRVVVAVVDRTV
ncbi:hypothetical protein IW262DRAFT_1298167 [Armillaria fumosa]|nr:hypothetical protein IW262DRAFT_1298167 [Armillaria fumosa]